MIRATLALFTRSMQMEARAFRTYLLRIVLLAVLLLAMVIVNNSYAWLDAPGRLLFNWIVYTNAGCIALVGLSFFAAVITEEKEEQTLGLLRMTKLNAVSILLGKSTTRLASTVVLLLAQVPFTLLAVTLGGVALNQIVAAYIALIAFTVFLANLGLVFSVVCKRTTPASFLTGLFIGLIFLLPGFFYLLTGQVVGAGINPAFEAFHIWVGDWLVTASPITRLIEIDVLDFEETAAQSLLHYHTLFNVLGGAGLFLIAWLLFDPCCRNETDSSEPRPMRLKFWKKSDRLTERELRRPWANALAWKDFHFVTGGTRFMWLKGGFYLLLFVLMYVPFALDEGSWMPSQLPLDYYSGWLMGIFGFAFVGEVGAYASSMFVSEIKQRTLSTLGLLPMSAGALCYRKLAGCLVATIPTAGCFLIAGLIYPDNLYYFFEGMAEEPVATYFVFSAAMLFFHLSAFLSLFMRWGPFVVAGAVTFFGMIVTGIMLALMGIQDEGVFVVLGLLATIASAVLHVSIPLRLEAVMSQ